MEKISVFAVISCRVTPLSAHCPGGRINCIKSRGCSCTSKFSSLSHPLDRSPNDFWLVNCADTKDPGIDCEALLTSYTLSFPAHSAHSHLGLAPPASAASAVDWGCRHQTGVRNFSPGGEAIIFIGSGGGTSRKEQPGEEQLSPGESSQPGDSCWGHQRGHHFSRIIFLLDLKYLHIVLGQKF